MDRKKRQPITNRLIGRKKNAHIHIDSVWERDEITV